MTSFRPTLAFKLAVLLYASLISASQAQTTAALTKEVIDANRALDQRLMDAHALKDAVMVESLFSESPDVFLLIPLVA